MPPRLSQRAIELLTAQMNVIAAWQVGAPTLHAMWRAHYAGSWRRLTSQVYLAAPCEATEEQLLWAASLSAGPVGMLAGQAALAGWKWRGAVATPYDLLVPVGKTLRLPDWIRVRRSSVHRGRTKKGIPRSHAAPACLDAAAWARTQREAMFILITTLQQRVVTPAALRRALEDRPTIMRRKLILATIDEYTGGAMSMGEMDFSRLCRRYGIRKPDRQVPRHSGKGKRYLDAYFDAERVVVEIDGMGHLDPGTWLDDQERQNDVVLQGDRIFLRVSTWALRYEPEVFMAQLRRALGGC